MARFVADLAVETVIERTAVHKILERLRDVLPSSDDGQDESTLLDADYQLAMLRWREEHVLSGVARRLKRGIDGGTDPVQVFSQVQDHVIHAARSHMERLVLEAFTEKLEAHPDDPNAETLAAVRDLFGLSTIEADRAWWMEHGRLSSPRSKSITREVNLLCRRLRPVADDLVDGFGVPVEMLQAEMLEQGY